MRASMKGGNSMDIVTIVVVVLIVLFVLGYFGRWCVLHGYLARGTDLVEGVQRYSMK